MQPSSLYILLIVWFVDNIASFANAQANPCDSNPCFHGGECFNSANLDQFVCDCKGQWLGELCETGCNERNTALIGNITSPNYPVYYNNRADCEYIIDIPNGLKISITFNFFNLEQFDSTKTEYDKLEYGSGSLGGKQLLGEFSAVNVPEPFEIEGGSMWFHFTTDDVYIPQDRGGGFEITWNATGLCGEPSMYPNSSYTLNKEDSHAVGSTANYTCIKDFKMADDDKDYAIHKCQLSNMNHLEWSGPAFKCQAIKEQSFREWFDDLTGLELNEIIYIGIAAGLALIGFIGAGVMKWYCMPRCKPGQTGGRDPKDAFTEDKSTTRKKQKLTRGSFSLPSTNKVGSVTSVSLEVS